MLLTLAASPTTPQSLRGFFTNMHIGSLAE
jgi:hypothetical protein